MGEVIDPLDKIPTPITKNELLDIDK